MSYAVLAELKSALRITDASDDALLQLALDTASGMIDAHCDRTFVASELASARSFPPSGGRVDVDDIWTTDGLIVAVYNQIVSPEVEGVSAGYVLEPLNAPDYGEPYTSISYSGGPGWPTHWGFWRTRNVIVTAKWGYAGAVPQAVRQACLLQASRLFARRNSPFGIAGSPDMGSELRLLAKVDPDVAVMLAPFVKMEVL